MGGIDTRMHMFSESKMYIYSKRNIVGGKEEGAIVNEFNPGIAYQIHIWMVSSRARATNQPTRAPLDAMDEEKRNSIGKFLTRIHREKRNAPFRSERTYIQYIYILMKGGLSLSLFVPFFVRNE